MTRSTALISSAWSQLGRPAGGDYPIPTEARRSILVAHPSAELYGSDRVLLESVEAMVGQGWRVVVALPGGGPLVPELTVRGAEVKLAPFPVIRKSALRPAGFVRFLVSVVTSIGSSARLIRRFGSDGVYVNTITIPTWLVLGRLLGRRVTCHVHEAEGSAPAWVRSLISLPLLFAQHILVNSQYSLRVLLAAVPQLRSRATVVYNGVPGPSQLAPPRAQLDRPTRLLFLGRLSPRKGPQVALAALKLLRARGVDVRLDLLGAVFSGYEWFEAELRAFVAAAGLDDSVSFLGFDADVWPHVQASDIVLVPSVVDEPFGNTAVEALLAGRPLVVSATSGLKEAAAGYAAVQAVEPDRADLLAAAVERIIAGWPELSAQALQDAVVASDRHSVRRYSQQIVEALTD